VSRRSDLLRLLIAQVLTASMPDLKSVVGRGSVLVDGTVCVMAADRR